MTVEVRQAPYAGWRALAATILVMAGATGAHTWAGGHLPSWWGLGLLGGVVLAASRQLLRRRAGWAVLLPCVALGQAGLHTSLAAAPGHATHAQAATSTSAWSWQMLLAHAAVTLLTGLVWWTCQRAAHVIFRVLELGKAAIGCSAGSGRARRPAHLLPRSTSLLHTAPRRGPPAALGCA